jgi:hypothetical protein
MSVRSQLIEKAAQEIFESEVNYAQLISVELVKNASSVNEISEDAAIKIAASNLPALVIEKLAAGSYLSQLSVKNFKENAKNWKSDVAAPYNQAKERLGTVKNIGSGIKKDFAPVTGKVREYGGKAWNYAKEHPGHALVGLAAAGMLMRGSKEEED